MLTCIGKKSGESVESVRTDCYIWTAEYDTRCYFNVRSKADISQLDLPHGTDN